ncbi:CDP-alcohol phosphatidyltransferase family protein [Rhodohalobacter sp. 8-1]|uniref:CDP-alcohol phosphatidyltransferase family protein n=1 Tax=Rhodohalobacter sp. 8-1 TaxID=3131972 RepID=UPI0030EDBF50
MLKKIRAYSVHLFTAAGAVLAFWSLILIARGDLQSSLFVIAVAVAIDSLDGTLARAADVQTYSPNIDGGQMDNIADYLNWVFIPVFWAYQFLDLPFWAGSLVLLASLFGFSHKQAKTEDHFFRGFPSYWNVVILYLYILDAGAVVSSAVVLILAVLVLLPVKFIYPSRTPRWKKATIILSVPYAIMIFVMLVYLRETPLWLILISFYYPVYYVVASVYQSKNN